ncbi:unnamed protein product [Phytophthora lilii]|uniref:Unnamed protein product n=1 Tax=Phytophthora lilii TaxID=2077276 RepID=A0A9W6WGT0_9STRA|nr:unnamed protein product [Phytophthora lilii]
MVKSNDRSAAEVKRVNQQLEERHYEFRSNCNDGEGDASACHSWGEWLAVVDKNYEAAAGTDSCYCIFTEKSCADGHAAGCHHVGFMRTQGLGCEKVCARGDRYPTEVIRVDAFTLINCVQDFAKGLEAFKQACERDDANSCNRVATMYLSPGLNSPIKRNIQEAKTYLEKACDANFAPACHNLAVMYKKGDESIPKDQSKYEEYRAKTEKLIEQAGGMSSIKSA